MAGKNPVRDGIWIEKKQSQQQLYSKGNGMRKIAGIAKEK
jgi:hypothetical protein